MESITYPWAFDVQDNAIVHIERVDHSKRYREYTCLGCGEQLIPILGDKRVHHFRHYSDSTCSPETFLHSLGKWAFYDTYNQCLANDKPFTLKYRCHNICSHCQDMLGITCTTSESWKSEDLTRHYKHIYKPETWDGDIRPDILLNGYNGRKIYVEIIVTSEPSLEKISREVPTILLMLKSDNDVYLIREANLSQAHPIVHTLNFRSYDLLDTKTCGEVRNFISVWSNGRSVSTRLRCVDAERYARTGTVIYIAPIEQGSKAYIREVKRLHNIGVPVRSCYACKHNLSKVGIACSILKSSPKGKKAVSCDYFV